MIPGVGRGQGLNVTTSKQELVLKPFQQEKDNQQVQGGPRTEPLNLEAETKDTLWLQPNSIDPFGMVGFA